MELLQDTSQLYKYKHFSHSRFGLYEGCPFCYKARYLMKLQEVASEILQAGRLAHEIIASYDRHLIEQNVSTDITVIPDLVHKIFFEPAQPHTLSLNVMPELAWTLTEWGDNHVLDLDHVVGVEEKMALLIRRDLVFWVIIDKLEIAGNLARITDYKDGFKIRPLSELKNNFQLRIYAWAVNQIYPQVTEFEISIEHIRFGITVGPVKLGMADIERTGEQIMGLIGKIERDKVFTPTPGAACSYCSFTSACPTKVKLDKPPLCTTLEQAQAYVEELAVLEKAVKDRKEGLQAWCKVNGNVECNGLIWGYIPSTSATIEDVKAFYDICIDNKIDPFGCLNFDSRKGAKLFKNEAVGPVLEALKVPRGRTTFKSTKAGGETDETE